MLYYLNCRLCILLLPQAKNVFQFSWCLILLGLGILNACLGKLAKVIVAYATL